MAKDVGILAMEVYFPGVCVNQVDLAKFDKVPPKYYTEGLGQERLAFCEDTEDVISMSLTVVKSLLENYNISPSSIGRLEVGSETVIDKSKSIKSYLMPLFEENSGIEGVDSTNACYGGTAALFNCVNWIESRSWDGRLAIVVAADIAVYAEGAARPSGGAGAVAMLVGPNAPLVLDRSYTGTYMAHVYDFYKPDLSSEYPVVDSKLSQKCYLKALDVCYKRYCERYESMEARPFTVQEAHFLVFHAPFNKLVRRSFERLLWNDYQRDCSSLGEDGEKLKPFQGLTADDIVSNASLKEVMKAVAEPGYDAKVSPSTLIPRRVGNMYCASLYAGLASLVHNKASLLDDGQSILMFSYGSGLASSLFSIRVRRVEGVHSLENVAKTMAISEKLDSCVAVSPEKFVETMKLMESRYGSKDFVPLGDLAPVRPGAFYLARVDSLYRRTYERRALT
ncbi:hypothetical protein SELMODRAFT_123543 [Selaginella moellendorffii]|uniref:Hydroxymethylglutaryl-CoA synthase n=1 Tax=Selaginella moellendorffii TaxID=88036 RepID=D8SS51_SELML|nr:hydroxymethylglutaryl-CoA synthase [Selaginella moellendorffii]EFJ12678.1 hypothetical protein SELMODRAFT_123543 [Selaginella moellendorffii]|eukprot:XP_002986147.1 hydroxymethylglutaryl-CoA synthase [Selaginella moellendorffii]